MSAVATERRRSHAAEEHCHSQQAEWKNQHYLGGEGKQRNQEEMKKPVIHSFPVFVLNVTRLPSCCSALSGHNSSSATRQTEGGSTEEGERGERMECGPEKRERVEQSLLIHVSPVVALPVHQ